MDNVVGDEFKFEAKTVQLAHLKRNKNITFRIPVPIGSSDLHQAQESEPSNHVALDPVFSEVQHSVNIRAPFKNLVERNIENIEKLFGVRMSLQEVESGLSLISSGEKAEASVNEVLSICRKSNVYNFYLCFPVRGEQFQRSFAEFQGLVRSKLGGSVAFEKRPHVTLALANLVTDSDIDLVVRALQVTSMSIKSVPKQQAGGELEPYSLEMEGLDVVKYRGKFAKRSVLMTDVVLSETLLDVAGEFQSTLNKTVNAMLNNQPKRKKLGRSDRLLNLTESQLAPKGIFLTGGGNVEITFTDVPLVDPNCMATGRDPEGPEDEPAQYTSEQPATTEAEPAQGEPPLGDPDKPPQSSETDEEYEFDTAVKNRFHVTLLRHQQVSLLKTLRFASKGHVVCAELRPRNGETCGFRAYAAGELVSFVGNRYDNRENEDLGTSQISGSQAPSMPGHLLLDAGAPEVDAAERFVFWI